MKRFVFGLILGVFGMLLGPVSFASDGPPTTKVCDFVDVDYDYSTVLVADATDITINVVFNSEKSGPECVIDVGKAESNDYSYKLIGIHSLFNWSITTATVSKDYYGYNDTYKSDYAIATYQEPTLNRFLILNRRIC